MVELMIDMLLLIGAVMISVAPILLKVIHRSRADAVINQLHHAMRLNLSLVTALRSAAGHQAGALCKRLNRLADELELGTDLAPALRQTVPEMNFGALGMIEMAERNGRLPRAIGRLSRHRPAYEHRRAVSVHFTVTYFTGIALTLMSLILALLVYVIPKFHMIFDEFGTSLPPQTVRVIRVSRFLAPWADLLFALIAIAVLARFIISWLPWRPRLKWLRDAVGWIAWYLPGLRNTVRNRALADVFFILAEQTRTGGSLHHAVAEVASLHVQPAVRRMMRRWALRLVDGQSVSEAAKHAGLPRMACGMIAMAERSNKLGEAFTCLQHFHDSRVGRSEHLIRAAMMPAMILFFATLVGVFFYAVFTPLPHLINTVIGNAPR